MSNPCAWNKVVGVVVVVVVVEVEVVVDVDAESEVNVDVEAHMVVAVVGEAPSATCQRNQSYKRLPRDNA